eukprot:m51a1_g13168 putative aminotransferase (474) ;mRNA; f:76082-77503
MWSSKLNPLLVASQAKQSPAISKASKASSSNGASGPNSNTAPSRPMIDCGKGSSPFKTSEALLARLPADVPYQWLVQYPHHTGLVDAIVAWWAPVVKLRSSNVLVTAGTMEVLTLVAMLFRVSNVLVAAGTAEVLSLATMLFRKPGGKALGYSPQFPEFEHNTRFMGIDYRTVPLRPEAKMAFSADDLIAAITEEDSVVYVDNPNNPTGQVIPLADIGRIVEAARAKGVCVLVDEAYGEYMDESNSAAQLVPKFGNLIVARTFSKGWGLAGVRAGYALACPRIISMIATLTNPFHVCEVGRRLIEFVLTADPTFPSLCRAVVRSNKPRITALCRSHLSVAATADTTPIMLLTHDDPACDLAAMFAALGVEVVSAASFRGLGPNSVRLRLPEAARLDAVLDAVQLIDEGIKGNAVKEIDEACECIAVKEAGKGCIAMKEVEGFKGVTVEEFDEVYEGIDVKEIDEGDESKAEGA